MTAKRTTPKAAAKKTSKATKSAAKTRSARTPAKATATAKKAAKKPTKAAAKAAPKKASAPVPTAEVRGLSGISEIRHFFRTNETPIYFIGAIAFNLLGLDRWVRNFHYISYYDAWEGGHPRLFSPTDKPYVDFQSGEEINNWLLTNAEVRAYMSRDRASGLRPKVAMVFFDEETERICDELGYDLILPPAALRERLDSKIVTTQLANEAKVPSVPNVLTKVATWADVTEIAEKNDLGKDLVIQTPYGDSGKTTFFISSKSDWDKHADEITSEDVKIMRRIRHRSIAVEAVITRRGTVVGPFMSELTGYPELTPYRGGWCGNEMFPEVLPTDLRSSSVQLVQRLGDRLAEEGYRGFFEVDLLHDLDSNQVYLGELNPRISGASAITNVTAGAYADVPLFLFHLLEFLAEDFDFELDVADVNDRWDRLASDDLWSQMVIKFTDDAVEQITKAPQTGAYSLESDGSLRFTRAALDWHQLQSDDECFFLRVYGPGDYRWKGADLGVVVTKGRLQTNAGAGSDYSLGIRARHLIASLIERYETEPVKHGPDSGAATLK